MPRQSRPAFVMLALVALTACNRDKPEAVPVQQGDSAPANPALTKSAPVTRAPAAPARPVITPEAAAAAELAKATNVRTVQVASFPSASMARWWAQKLQGEGIPAYVSVAQLDSMEVFRLRIGAAVSGAEARAIADRIRAQYHWPTWITTVSDRAALPANALLASRTYAGAR
jgi:cell division septation protein DedD